MIDYWLGLLMDFLFNGGGDQEFGFFLELGWRFKGFFGSLAEFDARDSG
jgi:hypothetical protein